MDKCNSVKKRGSKLTHSWLFDEAKLAKWFRKSRIIYGLFGGCAKIMIEFANKVKVYNKEVLHDLVEHRQPSRPLVTVSNHDSCLDDPLLFGLLKMRHITNVDRMRWALGGHDIMFTNEYLNWFFSYGQVVPVVRGNGVYQRSMDFVLEQLNRGGWVHIFPEGKVNMTKEYLRLKWGVGRLIAESKITPVVLPMWHMGIDDILPNRSPYIPRMFKKVTVNIGTPMDFSELIQNMRGANKSPMEMRKAITDVIQQEFKSLRQATEKLHTLHFGTDKSSNMDKFSSPGVAASVGEQTKRGATNVIVAKVNDLEIRPSGGSTAGVDDGQVDSVDYGTVNFKSDHVLKERHGALETSCDRQLPQADVLASYDDSTQDCFSEDVDLRHSKDGEKKNSEL